MPAGFPVFEEREIRKVATLNPASLAIIEQAFSALAEGRVIMPTPLGLHINNDEVQRRGTRQNRIHTWKQGIR